MAFYKRVNRLSRIAVVLGASEGIGFACAKSLLAEGNKVCIVSRNSQKLDLAKEELSRTYGNNILSFTADIAESKTIPEIRKFVASSWGTTDILVNSNGGPKAGKLLTLTDEDWHQGFNTFAMPVIRAIREFSTDMIRNKWGRIVTIGSIAAKEPIENLDLSNFIRSGFLGLHKSVSRDLAKHNINVHLVHPGSILTARTKQRIAQRASDLGISYEESEKISIGKIPKGKIGDAEEVGNLVRFLCSDQADYLTGTAINVDGGMSLSI
ncbi:SDR family oxidoreductase [Leptospira yasudae]|uniref:SDR family oxidoreductase n=1 Tax=Leptospira yasudae TaxID=2202201 RepID=UPI00108402FE|nr:SDR family oxidoreductase [Leptospira yasudae]TGK24498.1 SDR family oxidoreductase [Leptospira yasudae]TGM05716.1 SDR family oxidoreductase [Leptospira yasudae]